MLGRFRPIDVRAGGEPPLAAPWRAYVGALAVAGTVATPAHAVAQGFGVVDGPTASGWRVAVQSLGTWDDTVRPASGAADLASRIGAEGARLWQSSRTRIDVAVDGSTVRFRTASELDRTTYSASLRSTRRLTRRATGSFDTRLESAFTNRSISPVGEASLLPGLTGVRTQLASGGLAYRSSPKTTAAVRMEYQRVSFDTPALVGGWTAAANAQLSRAESRTRILRLDYEARRGAAARRGTMAHRLAGVWEQRLGEHLSAQLSTGVTAAILQGDRATGSVVEPVDEQSTDVPRARSTRDVSAIGGATLRWRRTRDLFESQYQHGVVQEFGRERATLLSTDIVALSYDRTLNTRLHARAVAWHSWGTETGAAGRHLRSVEGAVDVRYVARAGLAYTAGATLSRRDAQTVIRGRRFTLGAAYAWAQLRSMRPTGELP